MSRQSWLAHLAQISPLMLHTTTVLSCPDVPSSVEMQTSCHRLQLTSKSLQGVPLLDLCLPPVGRMSCHLCVDLSRNTSCIDCKSWDAGWDDSIGRATAMSRYV